ncbi:hypothetical protein, partial [Algiphilus sp.]|uniref:hypothetical protein n=1 Tax=Algiphilus sp. TaxID=1872431 RepID=UPI003C436F61
RSEFWPQELRRRQVFHDRQPELSSREPAMPWNSVTRAAARAVTEARRMAQAMPGARARFD